MKNIGLTDARPGMVLGCPVEDALGRVLINAGEELTEPLIKVLLRRGFTEIKIRPEEAHAANVEDGKDSEAMADGGESYELAFATLTTEFKGRFGRTNDYSSCDRILMRAALGVLVSELNARLRPE